MKKSKKNTPRPRFVCPKCHTVWIQCEIVCMVCGTIGEPTNESAEKVLKKAGE